MKKICTLLSCLLWAISPFELPGVELVRNGVGKCVIIIEKNPSCQLKQAAEELQHFLFRITGAMIPVVSPEQIPPDTAKIAVGENTLTRKAGYKMPRCRNSAYDIWVKDDIVVLNGPVFRSRAAAPVVSDLSINRQTLYHALSPLDFKSSDEFSDFGPMHAVSAFLELLGVRFYAPGDKGIILPRKKDISVPDMRKFREAAFGVREYTFSPDKAIDPELRRHLRFLKSGSNRERIGLFALAPILRKGGKQNPSWLALQADGTPFEALEHGGYPRYSSPSFRKKCLEELKKFIEAHPFINEILILPPVAVEEHIHAPESVLYEKKVYPQTFTRDIPAEFYLYLARQTARLYPGKRLLYRSRGDQLPGEKLLAQFPASLGGVPQSTGITAYAYPGRRKHLCAAAEKFVSAVSKEKVLMREFWNEYDAGDIPRRGFYFSRMLQELRRKQQKYLHGFLFDLPFDAHKKTLAEPLHMHFILYVNSKLLWEPDLDIDALEKEYCQHLFGPAAGEMYNFFRSAETSLCSFPLRGISPHYAKELRQDAAKLRKILDNARNATLPGTHYRKNIEDLQKANNWITKDLFADWEKTAPSLTGLIMSRDTVVDGDTSEYKKWYPLESADKTMPRTEAAFTFSENRFNIFAAFRCYEPQMKKLTANARTHDDPAIKNDDHVTLRINSAETGEYTFTVNSKGLILDSSSDPGMLQTTGAPVNFQHRRNKAKVKRYPDRWEVEFSMLRCGRAPAPGGQPWKVQLERRRFVSGKEQKSFLTGSENTRFDFHFPSEDAKGRKINSRYNNVNIPIPGIPDGIEYLIPRKKCKKISFSPEAWHGKEWAHATESRLGNILFSLGSSSDHVPDVRFKLQYDERALYVFFKVREKGVRAIAREDQQSVCLDSCVEIFLRPGGLKGKYYMNFEMNCVGALLLARGRMLPGNRRQLKLLPKGDLKKIKRTTSLKEASKEITGESIWYAGLEIPWDLVEKHTAVPRPGKGSVWTGNIYKCADWSRHPHWLAWKEVKTFHQPEGFGRLIFE